MHDNERRQLTEEERDFIARFAAIPDAQRERIFELAAMPEDDWQTIRSIPKNRMFVLGAFAVIGTISSILLAILHYFGIDTLINQNIFKK